MVKTAEKHMTVDEFILWAQSLEGKWELHDGVPVSMSPERALHVKVKYRMTRLLEQALEKSGSDCQASIDGLMVRINSHKSFQSDALVYCDDNLSDDALEVEKPLIVVEVLSPSTASYDLRDKLQGYFQRATIAHYLIVDADKKLIIHHRRGPGEDIITRIVTQGSISLDPPSMELAVDELFLS